MPHETKPSSPAPLVPRHASRALAALCVSAAAAALAGCASSTPAGSQVRAPSNAAAAPPSIDVAAMLTRESEAPASPFDVDVDLGEGRAFHARARAAAAPHLDTSAAQPTFAMSIGTQSDVTCTVYAQRVDPATTIGNAFRSAVGEGGQIMAQAPSVDVGREGATPILFAEAEFVSGPATRRKLALLKVAVAATASGSLVCAHDEVGYRRSFRDAVHALVSTARFGGGDAAARAPRYEEILVAKQAGVVMGFEKVEIEDGPTRGSRLEHHYASAMGATSTAWLDVDYAETITTDAAGEIIDYTHVEEAAGVVTDRVALERQPAGRRHYAYKGQRENKVVEGSFVADEPMTTPYTRAAKVKSFAEGRAGSRARELRTFGYDPSKPAGSFELVLRRDASDHTLSMRVGDLVKTCVLDHQGMCTTARWNDVSVERTFERGAP